MTPLKVKPVSVESRSNNSCPPAVISCEVADGSNATTMGLSAVPRAAFWVGTAVGGVVATGGLVAAGAWVVAVAQADKIKLAMTMNTNKVVSRFFTIQLLWMGE